MRHLSHTSYLEAIPRRLVYSSVVPPRVQSLTTACVYIRSQWPQTSKPQRRYLSPAPHNDNENSGPH